jgi:hypothetical protein
VTSMDRFFSIKESSKSCDDRVFHDTDTPCAAGRQLQIEMRKAGSGGYAHCPDCALNQGAAHQASLRFFKLSLAGSHLEDLKMVSSRVRDKPADTSEADEADFASVNVPLV